MNFIVLYTLALQTLLITPRYAGQVVRFGGVDIITEAETPVRVYGSGVVEISEGYWDQCGVFDGAYDGPWVADTVPATDSITLERSADGGLTWEPVIEVTDPTTLTDWESPSFGEIQYRATAFTLEGAATSTVITVAADSMALWLSGGTGFGVTARLPLNPDVEHTGGRQRALKQYAGRSRPVALSGEAVSRSVSVSGQVTDETWVEETASPDELTALVQSPDRLFLFRDPDGRRIYGVVGDVRLPRLLAIQDGQSWNGLWGYSFTLTEAD